MKIAAALLLALVPVGARLGRQLGHSNPDYCPATEPANGESCSNFPSDCSILPAADATEVEWDAYTEKCSGCAYNPIWTPDNCDATDGYIHTCMATICECDNGVYSCKYPQHLCNDPDDTKAYTWCKDYLYW